MSNELRKCRALLLTMARIILTLQDSPPRSPSDIVVCQPNKNEPHTCSGTGLLIKRTIPCASCHNTYRYCGTHKPANPENICATCKEYIWMCSRCHELDYDQLYHMCERCFGIQCSPHLYGWKCRFCFMNWDLCYNCKNKCDLRQACGDVCRSWNA